MKKLILFMMLATVLSSVALGQAIMTIGDISDAASTDSLPWRHRYRTSETQYGIPAPGLAALDCDAATAETSPNVNTPLDVILTMLVPGGLGSGTVIPAPGSHSYHQFITINILANPDTLSFFDYWELDGALYSTNENETLTMDTDHMLQAFFKKPPLLPLPFTEDFTGVAVDTIPAGWTRTHVNWGVHFSDWAGGEVPEMMFNDFAYPAGVFRLITPILDGSSVSNIQLVFKHVVYDANGGYTLRIQTSIDDGATWEDRWSVPGAYIWRDEVSVSLDAVGGEKFLLAFVFDGDPDDIYSWSIDDIFITETRELNMLGSVGQGGVVPNVGLHNCPIDQEITLGALPPATWYALRIGHTNDPFKFNPADVGSVTSLGTNSVYIDGGTWADGKWYAMNTSSPSRLCTVDTENGVLTIVGDTGQSGLHGLAYDEINDVMYSVSAIELFTIDRSTGAATVVGSLTPNLGVQDIAYGDGVLYAYSYRTESFYTIDVHTCAETLLGPIDIKIFDIHGLEYDKDHGRLFLTFDTSLGNYLAEADKSNGSIFTLFKFDLDDNITGLAIPYGIDHPWEFDHWEVDGLLYSNDPATRLMMDDNHTAQAFFKKPSLRPLPFTEDFTGVAVGTIPAGWDRTHINWGVHDSNWAGGEVPEMMFSKSYDPADVFRLITPLLDGSSASNIQLVFKHVVYDANGGYTLRIQTSTDDGATWEDRWSVTGEYMGGEVYVSLDAVCGEEFLLAFVFDGDPTDIDSWSIDDIFITETRELNMLDPVGQGGVVPNVGLHDCPIDREITLGALPPATWYALEFDYPYGPFKFNPADVGSVTYLGSNDTQITGGTWADGKWYAMIYDNPSSLCTIDIENGALTLVGDTGQANLRGLAYDEINDVMYSFAGMELFTIDRSTGAATVVGSFTTNLEFTDIAYGDGVLYAYSDLTKSIYTIDVQTCAETLLGPIGINVSYIYGFEYDKDHGRLFLTYFTSFGAYLAEADKSNGSVFTLFKFDLATDYIFIGGLAIPYGIDHPWEFDHWEVDGLPYSNDPATRLMMDDDHTAQAFFKNLSALPLPFTEDFTGVAAGTIPAGWSRTHTNWQVTYSSYAGGNPPETVFRDSLPTPDVFRLITPILDGASVSNIQLIFKHFVYSANSDDTLRIQTSIDGGVTWEDRWSVPGAAEMSGEVSVSLDAVCGQEFLLAFVFDGDPTNYLRWYIDDICITETNELIMLDSVGQGGVIPKVGLHNCPIDQEIKLSALPPATWYMFRFDNFYDSFKFNPADLGSTTWLGSNDVQITGGTWADGKWYAMSFDNPSSLYTVDTENGALTLVGETGEANLRGLAYDEINDVMYSFCGIELFTIDRSTGAATVVGTFTTDLGFTDIAYGDGVLYACSGLTDSIYTIDVQTCAETLLGPTGIDVTHAYGMEYDKDHGRLFMTPYIGAYSHLAEVDKSNGSIFTLFKFGISLYKSFGGLAIPYGIDHPWEFDRWEVDGLQYSNDPVTMLMMDDDHMAQAFFKQPSEPTPTEPPTSTPTGPQTPTPTEPPTTPTTTPATPTTTPATPTQPPTSTPTGVQTPTPTEPPATPTQPPEPTPTKTPEPTPGYPLGVRLDMPDMAHPGDEFSIIGYLDNPDAPLPHVATFFILEVYGKFWFWPSWVYFDYPEYAAIDFEYIDVPTGTTEIIVIPPFVWPDTGQDIVTGLGFYGAMLNPEMNDIMGEIAIKSWGYGP